MAWIQTAITLCQCSWKKWTIFGNFNRYNQNGFGIFRYKYQAGGWSAAGQDDSGNHRSNSVTHHEGWNSGKFWTGQERISFERVKLTNKEVQQGGNSLVGVAFSSVHESVIHFADFPCLNAKVSASGAAVSDRDGLGGFGRERVSAHCMPIRGRHRLPE